MLESIRNASSDATANRADLNILLQKCLLELQRLVDQFRDSIVTPAAFHQFESDLQGELRLVGRTVLEHTLAQLEPADVADVAPQVSFQGESYRRPRKQPKTIYSSFGPIEYSRFRYEACERGISLGFRATGKKPHAARNQDDGLGRLHPVVGRFLTPGLLRVIFCNTHARTNASRVTPLS